MSDLNEAIARVKYRFVRGRPWHGRDIGDDSCLYYNSSIATILHAVVSGALTPPVDVRGTSIRCHQAGLTTADEQQAQQADPVREAAKVLLAKWLDGHFEDGADAAADDAITDQWAHVDRTYPDAAPVIEAWLRALAGEQHD